MTASSYQVMFFKIIINSQFSQNYIKKCGSKCTSKTEFWVYFKAFFLQEYSDCKKKTLLLNHKESLDGITITHKTCLAKQIMTKLHALNMSQTPRRGPCQSGLAQPVLQEALPGQTHSQIR